MNNRTQQAIILVVVPSLVPYGNGVPWYMQKRKIGKYKMHQHFFL